MLSSSAHEIEPISKFHLSEEDFKKLIGAYKLKFEEQLKFNQEFEIENDKPQDETAGSLKIFLQEKLNEAFKDEGKLKEYQEAVSADGTTSDRGIHDGFHVANVALYAKKFLKIYQENKELFSPEIQKEIKEFDENKIRDLEVLCLMHDVARVNKDHDQAEYKNAFYVALKLREMGDTRFHGDEISEAGLEMIMDLASKESKKKDKSLMSKLIQASDSLAILRCRRFREDLYVYDFDLNDAFKDFSEIDFAHAPKRDKLQKSIRESVSKISLIEKNPHILLENLEHQENPQEDFLKHKKTILLMNAFDEGLEMLKTDDSVEAFPRHELSDMFYVHAIKFHSPYPLNKQGQNFICATILSKFGVIRSYADRSWNNNPVLILGWEDESGVVFSSGFKADVASLKLIDLDQTFPSNIEASHWVQMTKRTGLHEGFYDKMIYTQERMAEKLQEMIARRNHPELDISNGQYHLFDETGATKIGRIGSGMYQDYYSAPYRGIRTNSGELRHNEIHILNSVHIVHFVGIARDVFEHTPAHKASEFSDFSHFGLLRLKFYKDQINYEKARLLSLEKPMEDERFKNCVEFELSRVTNLFEKIIHLKKLKIELGKNLDHRLIIKSIKKKISKKSEHEGFEFQDSKENREIIQKRKIEKFDEELVGLHKKLEEFERSFGFTDLKAKAGDLCTKDAQARRFPFLKDENLISQLIKKWKDGVMSAVDSIPIRVAQDRVKKGLQTQTEMALYDIFNPQEIKILSEKEFRKKFVKTPELFKELCERKDYSSILLLYTKKEINQLSQAEAGSKLRDGSELPNYLTIYSETLDKVDSSKLGLLIKMGLDIYSLPDASDNQEYQIRCGPNAILATAREGKKAFCLAPYKLPESFFIFKYKLENPEILKKLTKFGVLFSEDAFPFSTYLDEEFRINKFDNFLRDPNKIEGNFKQHLLDSLKKYSSESDLSAIESNLEYTYIAHNLKRATYTLNGFGLLKMFEKHPNLTKGDKEMSALVNKLKILRGDKKPDIAVTSAQQSSLVYLTNPSLLNQMI